MDDSPLSRLPAELRNRIYELALLQDDSITISLNGKRRWRPPAHLSTCNQIRAEASSIYYAGNTFTVLGIYTTLLPESDNLLGAWPRLLSPSSLRHVRRVHMDDFTYPDFGVKARIERCKKYLEWAGVGSERIKIFVSKDPAHDYDLNYGRDWVTA